MKITTNRLLKIIEICGGDVEPNWTDLRYSIIDSVPVLILIPVQVPVPVGSRENRVPCWSAGINRNVVDLPARAPSPVPLHATRRRVAP